MKTAWWAAIAACLLLVEPVRADDRFAEAEAYLRGGSYGEALQAATAIAQQNPDDPEALILLGRAQIAAGHPEAAQDAALRAWQEARGKRLLRFTAARLGARSASDAGKYGAARLWLRRASDYADDAASRAVLAQSFAVLRRVDPSSTQFAFSIAPSDNINAGSSQDRLVVDGTATPLLFSGDARALSGVEYRLSFGHQHRISKGPGGETYLGMRVSGTGYSLSDDARRQAPDVTGQDFSNASAEVSVRRTRSSPTASLRYGAALIRTWYGGYPDSTRLRFDAGVSRRISPAVLGEIGLVVEGRQLDVDQARSGALSVMGGLEWKFGQQKVGGRLTLTQVNAPDRPSDAYKSATLAMFYVPALNSAYIQPKLGLSASVYDFDSVLGNVFGNDGRTDRRLAIEVQVDLPKIERMGFIPSITLGTARSWSNVSRYEGHEISAAFGIESSF